MPRRKLSEGWKIVISILVGFVIGVGFSMKFDPTISLIGGLSAAMVSWLIIQQF